MDHVLRGLLVLRNIDPSINFFFGGWFIGQVKQLIYVQFSKSLGLMVEGPEDCLRYLVFWSIITSV